MDFNYVFFPDHLTCKCTLYKKMRHFCDIGLHNCNFLLYYNDLTLQGLQKKFWTHFHNLCVQKWSCLLISLDAFWKFLPDEVYDESFGRIFTICVSKNEAVSCEVQRHVRSFHLARYITKVLGALSRFLRPWTKLFAVKFRQILEVFSVQALYKSSGHIISIF